MARPSYVVPNVGLVDVERSGRLVTVKALAIWDSEIGKFMF